ncbi:MAG: hypothetical protein J0I41_12020 [Filimonas sp.]|nr:hypothetical protein [Filimonas sp.]
MKNVFTLTLMVFLSSLTISSFAQKMYKGKWTVKEYILTTYSSDGKTIVKGPLTVTPKDYWVEMDETKYNSFNNGRLITYNLKEDGDNLLLSRDDATGRHTVTLSNLKKGGNVLTLHTWAQNAQNRDITVTKMTLEAKTD